MLWIVAEGHYHPQRLASSTAKNEHSSRKNSRVLELTRGLQSVNAEYFGVPAFSALTGSSRK